VEEIIGESKVTGVKLKNVSTEEKKQVQTDGVFLAIGTTPNTEAFKGQLNLDDNGFVITKEEVKTDIKGVFAAGDVADKFYKQAATAASSGVKAALLAREYLSNLKAKE
jgi:thioredoxin reductase (NADPH)